MHRRSRSRLGGQDLHGRTAGIPIVPSVPAFGLAGAAGGDLLQVGSAVPAIAPLPHDDRAGCPAAGRRPPVPHAPAGPSGRPPPPPCCAGSSRTGPGAGSSRTPPPAPAARGRSAPSRRRASPTSRPRPSPPRPRARASCASAEPSPSAREPHRARVGLEVVGVVDDRVGHRHQRRAPRRQAHVRRQAHHPRLVRLPQALQRALRRLGSGRSGSPSLWMCPKKSNQFSNRCIHFSVSSRLSFSGGTSIIPYSYPSNNIGLIIRAASL